MNVGTVITEIGAAIKAGETDLLKEVSTLAGNAANHASVPQLIIEGGELLTTIGSKYPDPKVQLVAGVAGALLTLAQGLIPATPAATPAK